MSKSLTINAPQIVQTRNTLNAVPSGSTAEPDYTVKFVPQDLTEEQQAQARQNIGAISASEIPASAQANWNETDPTDPSYIQNKPTIPEDVIQLRRVVHSHLKSTFNDAYATIGADFGAKVYLNGKIIEGNTTAIGSRYMGAYVGVDAISENEGHQIIHQPISLFVEGEPTDDAVTLVERWGDQNILWANTNVSEHYPGKIIFKLHNNGVGFVDTLGYTGPQLDVITFYDNYMWFTTTNSIYGSLVFPNLPVNMVTAELTNVPSMTDCPAIYIHESKVTAWKTWITSLYPENTDLSAVFAKIVPYENVIWNTEFTPEIILNKPDFSQMSYILFYQSAAGTTGFVNRATTWQNKDIFSNGEVYLDYNTKVTSATELRDTVVTAGTHIIHYTATGYSPAVGNWDKLLMEKYGPKVDYLNYYSGQGVLMIQSPYQKVSNVYGQSNYGLVETAGLSESTGAQYIYITTQKPMINIGVILNNNVCRSLFVPKGSGLRWRLKNKAIQHIYEYDSITIPEYGASFAPASSNFKSGLPKMAGVKEVIVDLTPYSEPFYFENDTDTAQTITLVTTGTPNAVTFEVSDDGGTTWTAKTVADFEQGFNIPVGEKLYIRGETTAYGKDNNNYYTITGGTKIGGNTMSLIYGSNFESKNSLKATGTFKKLFLNNTTLVDASNLLLPSLSSKGEDYYEMFKGCTALVSAPDVIELDNPGNAGFREMFSGCTNLVNAPMLLVSNLKTGTRQYNGATGMFKNCTSLVKAPDLIVTEIGGSDPVTEMFDGCTSLNYIKCTANIHNNISNWVRNVAASGTFITVPGTNWSAGNNGIPSGWTVKYVTDYYTEESENNFDSVPLTMTDANGDTISGDFVANNVTITPAV